MTADHESTATSDSNWDQQLQQALHNVAVPFQLSQRIAADLHAEQLLLTERKQSVHSQQTRRRWLQTVIGSGAAAILIGVGYLAWPRQQVLSTAELQGSTDWLETQLTAQWQALPGPVDDYPLPPVLRYQPRHWQSLQQLPGVAYELSNTANTTAALFVLSQPADHFSEQVPLEPLVSTQGVNVGYWQSGERLYVLIVAGTAANYRMYLHPGRIAPVA